MKILKIGGIMLLAAAAVFFGFHFFFGGEETPDAVVDGQGNEQLQELAYYRQLSEQLETELTELKEEQYTTNKEYEERIAELENLLKQQEGPEQVTPPSSAAYTYTVDGNAITITGYSGNDAKLSIPATIDGLDVVAIGREAFKDSALTEVVIPNSVKKIDWFAFYGSHQLASIAIPSSVTKIEYGAFDGCDKLTVYCEQNSYADKYARSYGMRVAN